MSASAQQLLIILGLAGVACASMLSSRLRSKTRRTRLLTASAHWAVDRDAQAAATPAQAEILNAAWAADDEISAFSGTLLAEPHVITAPDGLEMHGALAWAVGGGLIENTPRPGVLLVHTAVGPHDLFLRWRAQALATRGYVVLIADLLGDAHGEGWDPSWAGPRRAAYTGDGRVKLQQRTRYALDALAASPLVDGKRLAALGYCFGGRAVLDVLKAEGPQLEGLLAVASFHGIADDYVAPAAAAAAAPPPATSDNATHRQVAARALLSHAEADPFVPRAQLDACLAVLNERGCRFELQIFGSAGGAKHAFTNPAQALNENPSFGYDARADRAAWAAAKELLAEVFSQ
jgi:dienelactone hydrolase